MKVTTSGKTLFITLPCIMLTLSLISCKPQKDVTSFEAMNTFMTIQTYGKNPAKTNALIKEKINLIENNLSTTIKESEISKINSSNGASTIVSNETAELINFAKKMAEKTDGALNPSLYPIIKAWGFTTGEYKVPSEQTIENLLPLTNYKNIQVSESEVKLEDNMMIDLGAVGKGFAGDKAIEILRENNVKSALLDFGGNIQTLGYKPDGSEWTIGIKNPLEANTVAALKIHDKAVITSGGYERYFTAGDKTYIHIFDGKTGYPVDNDLLSVSIVCESGRYGDALSTALFVMGVKKAEEYWKTHKDFEMILITKNNEMIITPGLQSSIRVTYEFSKVEILEN